MGRDPRRIRTASQVLREMTRTFEREQRGRRKDFEAVRDGFTKPVLEAGLVDDVVPDTWAFDPEGLPNQPPGYSDAFGSCRFENATLRLEWEPGYEEVLVITHKACGHVSVRDREQLDESDWQHPCPGCEATLQVPKVEVR